MTKPEIPKKGPIEGAPNRKVIRDLGLQPYLFEHVKNVHHIVESDWELFEVQMDEHAEAFILKLSDEDRKKLQNFEETIGIDISQALHEDH